MEGLNAVMYLDTACPPTVADTQALLQGVDLSWNQEKVRFYHMGSLNNYYVLDGVVAFQGAFRKAFVTANMAGSIVTSGSNVYCGSICPRGASTPAILGSVVFTGGSLSNMAAGNANAVTEEESFIIFNLTFVG